MKILGHLLLAILFSTSLFGQDNANIKFGNISADGFAIKKSLVIGNDNTAVIGCDSGFKYGYLFYSVKKNCYLKIFFKPML
jgi:hypothetical protein